MFYHIRTTHIDQVNSPTAYIDHLNKIAAFGKVPPNYNANIDVSNKRKPSIDEHTRPPTVKSERNSPRSDRSSEKSPQTVPTPLISAPNIKQEEQEIATDLSKKQSKDEDNRSVAEVPAQSVASPKPIQTGSFLCNQCNAALNDFESFRNHLKSHISQGMANFVCQHCGLTLTNQTDYDRHTISHFLITNSEFCCNFNCNKSFGKADDLQKHLFEMHAQNLYKCSICSDMFETKVAIQVHFAVAHSNEVKIYRCSACMDTFKSENEFRHHVKTRHSVTGSVQCLFCRTVCASELEMHFHLAAHARQFRCPACPESFHVEFLLDRHMQTHHSLKEHGGVYHYKSPTPANTNPTMPSINNNNNILDYHQYVAAATAAGNAKNSYLFPGSKVYSQLQIDTNANSTNNGKHTSAGGLYGFYSNSIGKSRYETGGATKNLLEIYNTELATKLYNSMPADSVVGLAPPSASLTSTNDVNAYATGPGVAKPTFYSLPSPRHTAKNHQHESVKSSLFGGHEPDGPKLADRTGSSGIENGFSCGICEMNDFCSEAEAHTHRKVAHNIKTGVSLRCAYCNGNFRSRNELENHMKSNHNTTGKHKCLICDEIFPSPAVLAEHKLSHSKVGPSGKCSRCSVSLADVTAFKAHMSEHGSIDIPLQCICCRQTLNSEFEVGLHAR